MNPHGLWIALGVFGLSSIAWMLTLVPLGKAILRGARNPFWTRLHALAWTGLVAGGFWLCSSSVKPAHDLVVIFVILSAVGAIELAILAFGRALQKAQEKTPTEPVVRPALSVNQVADTPGSSQSPQSTSPARGIGLFPVVIGVVLLAWLTQRSPSINHASQAIHAHATILLGIFIPLAVLGFAGFMIGVVRLSLSAGTPMTREDVEQQLASSNLVGRPYWRAGFKFRVYGEAVGMQTEQTLTVRQIKQAWRSGEWRREPYWRMVFLITGSALLMIFAGLAIPIVSGPPVILIIFAGAVLYAATRLTIGWSRR